MQLNVPVVKNLLRENRMTHEQLAEKIRISTRTIQRALAGNSLRLSTIYAIAEGLGVGVEEIVKIESSRPRGPRVVMPVIFNNSIVTGPEQGVCAELYEIIAIRQADSHPVVLGYVADLDEWTIVNLLQRVPGGLRAFEKWGNLGDDAIYKFDPELGMLIGTAASPQVTIGRSGCRVQFSIHEPRPDLSETFENSGLIRTPPRTESGVTGSRMKRKFVYVDSPHDLHLDKAMIRDLAEQFELPPSHPDVKRLAELGLHTWPDGMELVKEIVGNLDDVRNWGATKIGWHVEVDVSEKQCADLERLALEHPKSISIHDTKQHELTDDDRRVLKMMDWSTEAM